MKKLFFIICIAIFAVCAVQAQDYDAVNRYMTKYSPCWPRKVGGVAGQAAAEQIGKPMPAFYFNKKLNSKSLRGKFVILNFWATWCGGCRLLSADLDSLMVKNTDDYKDVQIIGVDAMENLVNKGYSAKTFWKEKGFGYPMVDGEAADKCCESVNGGHPCVILIDDKGIVRGRWDSWTGVVADEIRLSVWALHILPQSGIKADINTVQNYLNTKEYSKALYLLETMPDDIATASLRFEVLMNYAPYLAVDYYDSLRNKYEADKPKDEISMMVNWKPSPEYIKAMGEISNYILRSNTTDVALVKAGWEASRLYMEHSKGGDRYMNYMNVGVLCRRYGAALQSRGEQNMRQTLDDAKLNNADTTEIARLKQVMDNNHVEVLNAVTYSDNARLLEDEKEEAIHKKQLITNIKMQTINGETQAGQKLTCKMILPETLAVGQAYAVEVVLSFADGWHGYSDCTANTSNGYIPTTVDFEFPSYVKEIGKAVVSSDAALYKGEVSFKQQFVCVDLKKEQIKKGVPITAKVNYQICNSGSCLPPSTAALKGFSKFK